MTLTNIAVKLGPLTLSARLGEYLTDGKNHWEPTRHSNAEHELHIVRKGVCRFDVDAKSFHFTAGDAILIRPGIFHGPTVLSDEFERFSLPFSLRFSAEEDLPDFFRQPYVLFRVDDVADRVCAMIFDEIAKRQPYRAEVLTSLFALLFANIIRHLREDKTPITVPAGETSWRTQLIDGFFERYLTEYGTEDLLAERLHISRRQLSRILYKQYGMSFRQKLIRARMDRAAYLLRTTDLAVSTIISQVGYASETAFFKAFQAQYHTTPRRYRKEHT